MIHEVSEYFGMVVSYYNISSERLCTYAGMSGVPREKQQDQDQIGLLDSQTTLLQLLSEPVVCLLIIRYHCSYTLFYSNLIYCVSLFLYCRLLKCYRLFNTYCPSTKIVTLLQQMFHRPLVYVRTECDSWYLESYTSCRPVNERTRFNLTGYLKLHRCQRGFSGFRW